MVGEPHVQPAIGRVRLDGDRTACAVGEDSGPLIGRPAAVRVCSSVMFRLSGVELAMSAGVACRTVWKMRLTSAVDCALPEPDPDTSTPSDGMIQLVTPSGCLVSQSATYA